MAGDAKLGSTMTMTEAEAVAVSAYAGPLKGKRGLVMGLANNRSIAWGIAKAARQAGAEIALTYQGEPLERRVRPLAEELDALVVGECDVTDTESLDRVFAEIERVWGKLDFVVHCIAFSDKDELTGRYVDTSAENFKTSLMISCYSFTAVAQRAEKLMTEGGSLLTLTYYGAEKWMPHYNVMGVAKAALDDRLIEFTFGRWEGLTWPEVCALDPEMARSRETDKWNFEPPGGESYAQLRERLVPWLAEQDKPAVVVSHGGVARALMAMIGGLSEERAPTADIWQGRVLVFSRDRFDWI